MGDVVMKLPSCASVDVSAEVGPTCVFAASKNSMAQAMRSRWISERHIHLLCCKAAVVRHKIFHTFWRPESDGLPQCGLSRHRMDLIVDVLM